MLKINNMKACTLNEELEIVTKTIRAHLYISKPWWSSHQASLIVIHQLYVHLAHASTTKAPILSRHVKAHTYIKTRGGDFGTHFLLGSRGLVLFGTQTFLLARLKNLLYHSKILQDGLYDHNVYICTL